MRANNLSVEMEKLYDMYIFNYLYLKQSINTDDLKFYTYDTIINYFFTSAPRQKFSPIMSFSSF